MTIYKTQSSIIKHLGKLSLIFSIIYFRIYNLKLLQCKNLSGYSSVIILLGFRFTGKGPINHSCLSRCPSGCPWRTFPENGSNDFLEIWYEVGNPEMMKSVRNRFLTKKSPPPFLAQKVQIWAKIALFRNLGKNGSNNFF